MVRFLPLLVLCACASPDGTAPETVPPTEHHDFFDGSPELAELTFEIEETALNALLDDPMAKEYVAGTFRFEDREWNDVGFRFKGYSSLLDAGDKKPWKVDFDQYVDGQLFDGLEKLNLTNFFRDPSFLREETMYRVFRDAGVVASRTRLAHLTVNGEDWGLYLAVEQVDDRFTRSHWGESGTLFKVFGGTLEYLGDDPQAYQEELPGAFAGREMYEFEHGEDEEQAFQQLIDLAYLVSATPIETLEDAVEEVFDVDSWLTTMAVYSLLLNLDCYLAHGGNYYLYRSGETGRFTMIPWDLNQSFGTFNCFDDLDTLVTHPIHEPRCEVATHPLVERILQVPTFQSTYIDEVERLRSELLAPDALAATVEPRHDEIEARVYADPIKLCSDGSFDLSLDQDQELNDSPGCTNYVPGVLRVQAERHEKVGDQLDDPTPPWPEGT